MRSALWNQPAGAAQPAGPGPAPGGPGGGAGGPGRAHPWMRFVVSSLGELSVEAFGFREELVSMFKHKVTSGAHPVFPFKPKPFLTTAKG